MPSVIHPGKQRQYCNSTPLIINTGDAAPFRLPPYWILRAGGTGRSEDHAGELGIIEPSKSPWASPTINSMTVDDPCPCREDDTIDKLGEAQHTTLEVLSGTGCSRR
jgi:hypothetical protein